MDRDLFIAVDVETTGFSPSRGDRVIEIGAVVIKGGRTADEFHSLVNIKRRIPPPAAAVHGITEEMLAGRPGPEAVFPQFRKFIGSGVLVAHNARFDVRFLSYELARLGLELDNRHLCTLEMSRKRYPRLRDHRLETVYRHLFGSIPEDSALHRALDDARMTARVWMEMMKENTV